MLLFALLLLPVLASLLTWIVRRQRFQLSVLLGGAFLHAGLTVAVYLVPEPSALGGLLALDPLGRLFLALISVIFVAISIYSAKYLTDGTHDPPSAPHRYVPCLLILLATMDLVTLSQHMALMWAAIEATTLASAPLIYFYRRKAALEATWKYLLLCSVGIALALLGTFFLGIAGANGPEGTPRLILSTLCQVAPGMVRPWMKAAFVLALVGYGTKMGLAPLHTWLPDAHSQAPSPVSALLSGGLLNCALLGILRFYQICLASGDAQFARELFLVLGFASLVIAAAFLIGQRDYKRLLAYSSVENMGIISVGLGLGGGATFGALLHIVNHSLCKAALFLLAGNLLRNYGSTEASAVHGGLRQQPRTSVMLLVGMLAIGGAPPLGPFVSELVIFMSAVHRGHPWLAILFLGLVAIAFLGLASVILPMLQGSGERRSHAHPGHDLLLASSSDDGRHGLGHILARHESGWYLIPPFGLLVAVVVLGLYLPPPLTAALNRAMALLSG